MNQWGVILSQRGEFVSKLVQVKKYCLDGPNVTIQRDG